MYFFTYILLLLNKNLYVVRLYFKLYKKVRINIDLIVLKITNNITPIYTTKA